MRFQSSSSTTIHLTIQTWDLSNTGYTCFPCATQDTTQFFLKYEYNKSSALIQSILIAHVCFLITSLQSQYHLLLYTNRVYFFDKRALSILRFHKTKTKDVKVDIERHFCALKNPTYLVYEVGSIVLGVINPVNRRKRILMWERERERESGGESSIFNFDLKHKNAYES